MSEHNSKTLEMYKSGGALEYIVQQNQIDPETEKWERLFNYVENNLKKDKTKKYLNLVVEQVHWLLCFKMQVIKSYQQTLLTIF